MEKRKTKRTRKKRKLSFELNKEKSVCIVPQIDRSEDALFVSDAPAIVVSSQCY
jgi:hypothetical protein